MSSKRDIHIILGNLKGLFVITAIVMAVMTGLCYVMEEPENATGFACGFLVSLGITAILWALFPRSIGPELRHAMILAALAYLIVPAISAIPFIMIEHMSILDAFFEGISGWTGSGFSMIAHPEESSRMIQLWRSVTQWIGGIGVIVLMVTILIRPGTSTYILYQSEARREKIHPSIRSTLKTIWLLYILLTVAGILLLYFAGMPLWDSINHSMVTIGTGGFSIYSNSIAVYNNVIIELAIIPMMLIGALPFVAIYRTIRDGKGAILNDVQVRMFFVIIAIGSLLLVAENFLFYQDIGSSIRYSVFQLVSAITSTGLQTCDISGWSPSAILIVSLAMIIGGCAGSTAGGIKVARAIFLNNEVKLWLKKTLLSRNAIVTLKMGNKTVTEDILNHELVEATLISFLWVISIMVSVMALSHVVGNSVDFSHIIFEVCSAQGNVGITCGIVNPGLHYIGKIIIIMDMWIGRLEIIPVALLMRYIFKGFRI